jgi:CRP-like cAMP-binding protein
MVQIFTPQGRRNQKLSAGEAFAEIFLFEEGSSNFRAEAHSDCEILVVRRVHFQQLLREHGTSAMQVATAHMIDVAKLASKKIVNTPLPSVRCLLAGQDQKRAAAHGEKLLVKSPIFSAFVLILHFTLTRILLRGP